MKRNEFIHRLQIALEANARELYADETGDPCGELTTPLPDLVQAIWKITTVDDAFQLMQWASWNISSAVTLILRVLIPDLLPGEGDNIPLEGWDT